MTKYTAVGNVLHDGKLHAAGDDFSPTPEQAEHLLSVGVIALAPDKENDVPTVAVLLERLAGLKIEVPPGAKKADLLALYDEAVAATAEDDQP